MWTMVRFHSIRAWLVMILLLLGSLAPGRVMAQSIGHADQPLVQMMDAPPVPEGFTTVQGPYVMVHGHPGVDSLLLDLSQHANASIVELGERLGVPVGGTIHVFVAQSTREFHALQGGRVPEWADGTAWPEQGAIYLRQPRARGPGARPLHMVLDHELVHVLLGRAFAPQHPPRWLQEGMAQVYAGEHDPNVIPRLARGMATGGLLSLQQITHAFPGDAHGADLAYAQSADFVSWLDYTYGEDATRRIVQDLSSGATIDSAVRRATGLYLEDADQAWRAHFNQGVPFWIVALGDMQVWWGGAAVGAVVGLLLAYRRRQQRMRDYAEEESRRDAALAALLRGPSFLRLPIDKVMH